VTQAHAHQYYTKHLPYDGLKTTSAVLLICAFIFVIAGLLLVIFSTLVSLDSNYNLVLEQYRDEFCANSTYAFVPSFAADLAANDQCVKLETAGSEFTTLLYARAVCSDGGYMAEVVVETSMRKCRSASPRVVSSGSCKRREVIFGTAGVGYFSATCIDAATGARRFSDLAALATFEPPTELAEVEAPPVIARPRCTNVTGGRTRCFYPFVTGSVLQESSSHEATRIASMSTRDFFIGDNNPKALIIQTEEAFQEMSNASVTINAAETTALEERLQMAHAGLPQNDTQLSAVQPIDDPDYPIGFVFNNFGTDNEIVGTSGLNAQRYLYVQGGNFDIGNRFGTAHAEDGAGFTISMWLRASGTTSGFAFALTDFYEDRETRNSEILSRIQAVVINNRNPADSWFNDDFHVYASLLVDGASQSLRFIHAKPINETAAGENPVEVLEWRVEELENVTRLFNGFWHRVHLIFANEFNTMTVLLAIDAETSLASPGWKVCANRRLEPIRSWATAPLVTSRMSSKVLSGGVLYVGYFNGGVGMLQFEDYTTKRVALTLRGTPRLKGRAQINVENWNLLAGLLFTGGVFAILAAGVVMRRVRTTQALAEHAEGHASIDQYNALLLRPEPLRDPSDTSATFNELPWELAKRYLDVSNHEMIVVVREIRLLRADEARAEFVRTLWTARRRHVEGLRANEDADKVSTLDPLPLAADWNAAVAADIAKAVEEEGAELFRLSRKKKEQGETGGEGEGAEAKGEADPPPADGTSGIGSSGMAAIGSSLFPSFKHLVQPFIHTMQGIAVYSACWSFPDLYKFSWVKVFDFISLDFAQALNVSQLATPFAHFAAGLIVSLLIIYFAVIDNRQFRWNVAKYTQRRDINDAVSVRIQERLKRRVGSLDEEVDDSPEYEYRMKVLPAAERCKVQRWRSDDSVAWRAGDRTKVTVNGEDYIARKGEKEGELEWEDGTPCDTVGVCCREHPDRVLGPLEQNDVWPFSARRSCCVYEGNERCGTTDGEMFCCNDYVEVDGEKEPRRCDFAVCAYHYNATVPEEIHGRLAANARLLRARGIGWLVAFIVVMLLSMLYTPLVRTAIMVLRCHPVFQCVFGTCWENVEPLFAIAAYLEIVILVFFGVGIPLFVVYVLNARRGLLQLALRSREYHKRYLEDDVDGGIERLVDIIEKEFLEEGIPTEQAKKTEKIALGEWLRFLGSDDSVLASLYDQLSADWIFYLPLMLLFKLALVIPPIFFEPDSFDQMAGVAGAELAFALFVCTTTPYMSPWVDLLQRASSAHQLFVLGLQALQAVALHEGKDPGYDDAMTFVTSFYVFFCLVMFINVMVWPILKQKLDEAAQVKALERNGLASTKEAPMILLPKGMGVQRCRRTSVNYRDLEKPVEPTAGRDDDAHGLADDASDEHRPDGFVKFANDEGI